MSIHFIGVDAGGTSTRALLATESGEVLGVGRAAGANSWSSGTSVSGAITAAVGAALGQNDPASVVGGVIAIAGGGASSAEIAAEIDDGWRSLRLTVSPDIVLDVLAAYAAGTTAPHGLVLAAGTGAIAGRINDLSVERRAGGHGWMVGDEGSAVWLGRKGTQAALQALDGRGPDTVLATMVPEALDIHETANASIAALIVTETYSRPPARLGELAPLVLDAGEGGDPIAHDLVEAAARHLAATAVAVMGDDQPPAIVLAGSLLTRTTALKRRVRADLTARWPAAPMTEATSGEAGAVALALAQHRGVPISAATLSRLREGRAPRSQAS